MVPYRNFNWVCHTLGFDPDDEDDREEVMELVNQGILKQQDDVRVEKIGTYPILSIDEASVYRWLRKREELTLLTTQQWIEQVDGKLDSLLDLLRKLIAVQEKVYKVYLIGLCDAEDVAGQQPHPQQKTICKPKGGGHKRDRIKRRGYAPLPVPASYVLRVVPPSHFLFTTRPQILSSHLMGHGLKYGRECNGRRIWGASRQPCPSEKGRKK